MLNDMEYMLCTTKYILQSNVYIEEAIHNMIYKIMLYYVI